MRFIPNRSLDNQLKAQAAYRAELTGVAGQIASHAKAIAPVDTGAYRDSIHVEQGPDAVRVTADDFKAWWIEYGTARGFPAFGVLRRSAQATGLKVRGRK